MEIGTDINELFVSTVNKNIDVIFNNKIWKFIVRDLSWAEKNDVISKSTGIIKNKNGGKATFDVNKYNLLYLEKCVVESPFEMTRVNILKLDDKFGDLLIEAIVDRGEKMEEDEEKN